MGCIMTKWAVWGLLAGLVWSGEAVAVGAIAIDNQLDGSEPIYGIAMEKDSKEAAKRKALRHCRESGGSDCIFVVWFETCGAVATARKRYGYGYGVTKAKAVADALEMCGRNSCQLLVAECEE